MPAGFSVPIPKSPFVDPRTGLISRDWYLFLINLFDLSGGGTGGTTTQVLHGGGAGFAQVNLTGDVTGILPSVNGGTGVNNGLKKITLGGNLTTTPSHDITFITVGATTVTLPASGTLITGISLSGDVLALGVNTGAAIATIAANAITTSKISPGTVTYTRIQDVSANVILGRKTSISGIVEEITVTGDLQQLGSSFTVTANAISNAKLAQMAARTVKGNNTATTANPTDIAAGQLPATQTNDNASAGNLGEYVSSTVTSGAALSLTTASPRNITSMALTGGDWDITGQVDYVLTAATTSDFKSGASTTSATFVTQDTFSNIPLIATGLSDTFGHVVPTSRISVTTTVTAYLVAQATFSLGTSTAYGTIRARRAR